MVTNYSIEQNIFSFFLFGFGAPEGFVWNVDANAVWNLCNGRPNRFSASISEFEFYAAHSATRNPIWWNLGLDTYLRNKPSLAWNFLNKSISNINVQSPLIYKKKVFFVIETYLSFKSLGKLKKKNNWKVKIKKSSLYVFLGIESANDTILISSALPIQVLTKF